MTSDEWQMVGIVVTLGIAIVGWSRANRAERHARTANHHAAAANRIAEDAVALAQSAEDRATRLEQISLEKRDVAWAQRQVENNRLGTLSFQHIGTDPALDVHLVVDPLSKHHGRQEEQLGRIEPGGRIGINLTTLANESAQRAANAGPNVFLTRHFKVRARVTWRSESGVSGVQEWESLTVG